MANEQRTHFESNGEFVKLLAKHEPEIRAFIRASLPSSHDVTEVIQNVSIVAWKKFNELDNPTTDFAKWACVIARFEILKYRRRLARDRFVLGDDLVEKLCEEGTAEISFRAKQINALDACLNKLPDERRAFVLKAYTPGESVKAMAARRGENPDALYQLLRRIRRKLELCIKHHAGQGKAIE